MIFLWMLLTIWLFSYPIYSDWNRIIGFPVKLHGTFVHTHSWLKNKSCPNFIYVYVVMLHASTCHLGPNSMIFSSSSKKGWMNIVPRMHRFFPLFLRSQKLAQIVVRSNQLQDWTKEKKVVFFLSLFCECNHNVWH